MLSLVPPLSSGDCQGQGPLVWNFLGLVSLFWPPSIYWGAGMGSCPLAHGPSAMGVGPGTAVCEAAAQDRLGLTFEGDNPLASASVVGLAKSAEAWPSRGQPQGPALSHLPWAQSVGQQTWQSPKGHCGISWLRRQRFIHPLVSWGPGGIPNTLI